MFDCVAQNCIACVAKCWDNSRFVSTCSSDTNCLCKDAFFQSVSVLSPREASVHVWPFNQAILQCLYTQCQTSQFGAAVHQALLTCSTYETFYSNNLPQLIRHQSLRKRSSKTLGNMSSHASASVIRSIAHRSTTFSTFSNPYPSKSVAPIADQEEQGPSAIARASRTVLNSTAVLSTLSFGNWFPCQGIHCSRQIGPHLRGCSRASFHCGYVLEVRMRRRGILVGAKTDIYHGSLLSEPPNFVKVPWLTTFYIHYPRVLISLGTLQTYSVSKSMGVKIRVMGL